MKSTFDILLQQHHDRVDHALAAIFASLPNNRHPLSHAMQYGTLLGGKRLRPFLVYVTGEMFGASLTDLDAPAAAIECIHAYSLIHDDLPAMDNDTLRRGQPTCHIKYGDALAVLAGDALQTLAFSILSQPTASSLEQMQNRLAMIQFLASASGVEGMCHGQALDLAAEGNSITLAELETIHQHKTGALIRCAVHLGRLAANKHDLEIIASLDQYATAIGLAFQVQDDILDIIGTTESTGKHTGSDAKALKNTYPSLLGLKASQQKAQELYQKALDALDQLTKKGYNTAHLQLLAHFIIQRDN